MLGSIGPTELILAILVAIIVAGVLYIIGLKDILGKCKRENRAISPGQVFLLLIPVFNIIWHFAVVLSISKTVKREFDSRGIVVESDFGKSVGIAMCTLFTMSVIPFGSIIPYVWDPVVGLLMRAGAAVCWIAYWITIHKLSERLDPNGQRIQPAGDDRAS